jgi:hypothetical protein
MEDDEVVRAKTLSSRLNLCATLRAAPARVPGKGGWGIARVC